MDLCLIHNNALLYIEEKLKPIVESIGEQLEGHIFEPLDLYLSKRLNVIIACHNKKKALEIGFNSGYSALLILLSNPDIQLTCVDVAWHQYTIPCYEQIKKDFGNRIQLIVGDSINIVPSIYDKYDFVHIDGGHGTDIASSDIINTNKLLMDDAVIIMDDVDVIDLSNVWVQLRDQLGYKEPTFEIFKNKYQDVRVNR